jgi:uncharacterized protein YegL
VLTFSDGAEWMFEAPVEADSFKWKYLDAEGVTDMGYAFAKLNEKLSRNEFMDETAGSFAPAIFLLSDGEPTDNFGKELDALKKNNWFKNAIKVAIAIGDDANVDNLEEFTGAVDSVLKVHSPEALKKMIRFVSVHASKIGSQSSTVRSADAPAEAEITAKQEDFNKQIRTYNPEDTEVDSW